MGKIEFPQSNSDLIQTELESLGYSLSRPKKIADCVLKMSNFYIENPEAQTPWKEKWCRVAQLAYYFILNWNRSFATISRIKDTGYFSGISTAIDWGAGLGAFSLPLKNVVNNVACVENEAYPQRILNTELGFKNVRSQIGGQSDLLTFSYSLSELKDLPSFCKDFENIIILEPSTRDDSRRLLQIRKQLIGEDYFAWAPCTHQEECPLLEKSKKDWCHDRVETLAPDWFWEIDKLLPIKNKTVTFSYLAMSRRKPADRIDSVRLVGDMLKEKGKFRIAACRGPEREFLSWLKKDVKKAPNLHRGDLMEVPAHEKKGDELRVRN